MRITPARWGSGFAYAKYLVYRYKAPLAMLNEKWRISKIEGCVPPYGWCDLSDVFWWLHVPGPQRQQTVRACWLEDRNNDLFARATATGYGSEFAHWQRRSSAPPWRQPARASDAGRPARLPSAPLGRFVRSATPSRCYQEAQRCQQHRRNERSTAGARSWLLPCNRAYLRKVQFTG